MNKSTTIYSQQIYRSDQQLLEMFRCRKMFTNFQASLYCRSGLWRRHSTILSKPLLCWICALRYHVGWLIDWNMEQSMVPSILTPPTVPDLKKQPHHGSMLPALCFTMGIMFFFCLSVSVFVPNGSFRIISKHSILASLEHNTFFSHGFEWFEWPPSSQPIPYNQNISPYPTTARHDENERLLLHVWPVLVPLLVPWQTHWQVLFLFSTLEKCLSLLTLLWCLIFSICWRVHLFPGNSFLTTISNTFFVNTKWTMVAG